MKQKKLTPLLSQTYSYLSKELIGIKPQIVVVLGSGLGKILSKDVISLKKISYSDIPNIPESRVSGHDGILDIIKYKEKIVAVMRGRFHTYEGDTPDEVVRLLRALGLCGIKTAILTNATGSTSLKHKPGTFLLVKDHINMTAQTPLYSNEARSLGTTFVDVSEPYSLELRSKIKIAAKKNKTKMPEGVYAWMIGPQYETVAEVKMLNKLGADVVGMSTVAEVIALRQMNIETACISTVTNYGTGVLKGKKLSHEEVKNAGMKIGFTLDKLLKATIEKI